VLACDFFIFLDFKFKKKTATCQNMILPCVNYLCEKSRFGPCICYFVSI